MKIDSQQLKQEVDTVVPAITAILGLVPGVGPQAVQLLNLLQFVADNDQIRDSVVKLINEAAGN